MRPPNIKRLQKEDFKEDDRALIDKLAYPLNSFMEQTVAVLTKGVDFQNLNQQLVNLDVIVDAMGIPVGDARFKSGLKSNVAGVVCINLVNLTNPGSYPTGTPFLTSQQNGELITVQHITNLTAGNRYQLRLLVIGF